MNHKILGIVFALFITSALIYNKEQQKKISIYGSRNTTSTLTPTLRMHTDKGYSYKT